MRRFFVRQQLVCVAMTALLATACSRDPRPGTEEEEAVGERLMRQMSDTLANAQAMSFATTEMLEGVRPNGEKSTSHFSRRVTVRRQNGLFLELHGSGGTELEVAAYYDGKTLSLQSDVRKVWAQTEVPDVNQPGAAGNRGVDPGVNQPGAAGNRGFSYGGSARQTRAVHDPGLNQPGAAGNVGRDPGVNQPGRAGNRRR